MMLLDDEQLARNNPNLNKLDYYSLIDVITYTGAKSVQEIRDAVMMRNFPAEMTRQEKCKAGFVNVRSSRWTKEAVHEWGKKNAKLQTSN